jgi:hypothetical protein
MYKVLGLIFLTSLSVSGYDVDALLQENAEKKSFGVSFDITKDADSINNDIKKGEKKLKTKQRKVMNDIMKEVSQDITPKLKAAQNLTEKEKNFCYGLKSEKAKYACLGYAFSTTENAKNIILNNCYSLTGTNKEALIQVCTQGKQGCYSFKNSDVVYNCTSCNGSNRWLRTYAAGSSFSCY